MPVAITFSILNALDPVVSAGSQGGSDFTLLSYTPVPGLSVEGCNALDVFCKTPITSQPVSDDAGQATVTAPENFSGYFEFAGPGFLPSTLYPGRFLADASTFRPVRGPQYHRYPVHRLDSPGPDAGQSGGRRGQAFVQVYDCFNRYAPGVTFTFGIVDGGPNVVQWYIDDTFPSKSATQTDPQGTGAS